MADYDNRIQVDLPEEIQFIRRIWMNADEKQNLFSKDEIVGSISTNHMGPGDVVVFKIVILVNGDMSWTAFRGAFRDTADAVIKHGLVLSESAAIALFSSFSKFYKHPYRFG